MRLNIKYVKSLCDLFSVALIRNECRKFLTNDSTELTIDKQVEFYNNPPKNWSVFLMDLGEIPIGYGIIKEKDGKAIITGCIIESKRGQGYGEELFKFLTNLSNELYLKPTLDVYESNTRAVKLYEKIGYIQVGKNHNKLIMEYK